MKKLYSWILLNLHCFKHLFIFLFGREKTAHQELHEYKSYQIKGIEIWFMTTKLSCTCGKCFYERK
jgi:hypothetical protein